MFFNWDEFLELARDLQGRTGSGYSAEAANRTAVSRAYYASFCRARDYAKVYQGFRPTETGKDHAGLRKHFRSLGWIEVAEDLEDLHGWRKECDYDNSVSNLQILLRSALDSAERVLEHCR